MRFIGLFALVILSACATAGRGPSSLSGMAGEKGAGGSDGHAGQVVFASGCVDAMIQMIQTANKSGTMEDMSGMREILCPSGMKASSDELKKMHSVLDGKIGNLLVSGFFPKHHTGEEKRFPSNLEGLDQKIEYYDRMLQKVEKGAKRNFGCFPAEGGHKDRRATKASLCFDTEYRYVHPDGVVEIQLNMNVFDPLDPKRRLESERIYVAALPEPCPNGPPNFTAVHESSSGGQRFIQRTRADCGQYDSEYTAIYPGVFYRYAR